MKPRRQIDAPDSASFGQDEKAAQQVGSKPL
jgi:hypothetical protein